MTTKSKNGGLPARMIAPLLGCSIPHTRRLLRKARLEQGRELSLGDIGNLIYEYRRSKEQKKVDTVDQFLRRWTGPS